VDADNPAFITPDKFIGEVFQKIKIVELQAIRALLNQGFSVVAVGGEGIPVVRGADGELRGVAAVVDKGGRMVIITRPDNLHRALKSGHGTHITV